ncbi:polycomb group RING finger protein 3-like [Homalodisca vitripennis]|uniref:polycomb group RING finger protein 3-like n=1 Tax=Homalodisca vitripennis TaxID=197043 RepID=UPI001EEB8B35|nr:polycomb group RING finger protein 3-like [Homalodisca vitripennis]
MVCRSCIVLALNNKPACPVCKLHVNQAKLGNHLKRDNTLQTLVYNLVPGLYESEMTRKKTFYEKRGFKGCDKQDVDTTK